MYMSWFHTEGGGADVSHIHDCTCTVYMSVSYGWGEGLSCTLYMIVWIIVHIQYIANATYEARVSCTVCECTSRV